MMAISRLTKIDLNLIMQVEEEKKIGSELLSKYGSVKEAMKYLNTFHLNEIEKRGWIRFKSRESFLQNAIDLLDYLKIRDFNTLDNYIDKNILFKKNDNADD